MSPGSPFRQSTELLEEIRRRAFRIGGRGVAERIGAEVELIPVDTETRRVLPIESADPGEASTMSFLRAFGGARGWIERRSEKGVPSFALPDGGTLTFEPGGQIELSSAPCAAASDLLRRLHATVFPLRWEALDHGIDLLAVGIDPVNHAAQAALQLRVDRYCRMAEYFAGIGPAGAKMMRQTAAFQLSLDFGREGYRRWRFLNAAAPYFVAMFANSPFYGGERSGKESVRACVWREVDASRTGVFEAGEDAAGEYMEFALSAPAIMLGTIDGEYRPFRDWLGGSVKAITVEDWHLHLSTLFPEVRPRGYLEVRSADALPPEWYAAPIALLGGLLYHDASLQCAAEIVGVTDSALLRVAGEQGLSNERLALGAKDLARAALDGCVALGERFMHSADVETAREFFTQYTMRDRSLANTEMDALASP